MTEYEEGFRAGFSAAILVAKQVILSGPELTEPPAAVHRLMPHLTPLQIIQAADRSTRECISEELSELQPMDYLR
jgi:hypothetical protein